MSEHFDRTSSSSEHVRGLLSAYIDNRLAKSKQAGVREHLEVCQDCRADYIELRATRQMLRSLPTVPPPRAFTLTQDMVTAARPGFWLRLLAPRNSPRFALGSALSFTLLVFLLIGNFVTSSRFAAGGAATTALESRAVNPAYIPLQSTAPRDSAGNSAAGMSNYAVPEAAATPQIAGEITHSAGDAGGAPAPSGALSSPPMAKGTPALGAYGQPPRAAGGINPIILTPQPTAQGVADILPFATSGSQGANDIERVPTLNGSITASTITSPSTYKLDSRTKFASPDHSSNGATASGALGQSRPRSDVTPQQQNIELSPSLMVEASLALVGIALAMGAFLARRR